MGKVPGRINRWQSHWKKSKNPIRKRRPELRPEICRKLKISNLLEVSSPGIERDLTRPEHFDYCAGAEVELRLFAPVDGSKTWRGILKGLDEEGRMVLEIAGVERVFEAAAVSKAKTVFDF